MKQMLAVARVTYREAIRNRVMYSLLFFAVVLFAVSGALDQLTTGQQGRIVLDLGLAGVELFGAVVAVFLGVSLMSREIARRTLHVVLAKAISRPAFLAGKYLGLMATLTLLVTLMAVVLAGVVTLFGGTFGIGAVVAVVGIWLELGVLVAVALLFSVFSGPFLAGMFTLGVFVIGHLSRGLALLGAESGDATRAAVTRAIYYLVPDLEVFNLKSHALYGLSLPWDTAVLSVLYALAYIGMLMAVAGVMFNRRDFH